MLCSIFIITAFKKTGLRFYFCNWCVHLPYPPPWRFTVCPSYPARRRLPECEKHTKNRSESLNSTIDNPTPFPPIILSSPSHSPFPNIEYLTVYYKSHVMDRRLRCLTNVEKLDASQTLRFSDFFIDSFFAKTKTLQFISFYGGRFISLSTRFSHGKYMQSTN